MIALTHPRPGPIGPGRLGPPADSALEGPETDCGPVGRPAGRPVGQSARFERSECGYASAEERARDMNRSRSVFEQSHARASGK